jgi:hypothetical protein
MKPRALIIGGFLAVITSSLYGQGQLVLDNLSNTSTSPFATANGLFWISTGGAPVLLRQDFNAAFYGGTDSSSLSPIATFLLSNGSAVGDNQGGSGIFLDPRGNLYTFPSLFSVFVRIQAWTGNFNSYAAAVNGGAPAAQSPVFSNPLGVPPADPAELFNMPAMVLSVPEPSTFVLAGLGGLSLLLLCRRRKSG